MSEVSKGQNFAHRLLSSTSVLAVLMGTTLLSTAHAQSTSPSPNASQATGQNGSQVEEVVVTAERRSERLIDVPAAISVVTAQDIQDKHLIALADIAREVPNVVISTSSLFPDPTIRGVGSAADGNPGFAPASTTYVDEVYQGRDRATNIPLAGISQIEVLRGPQGTLYGKNTIAGAINITTQKPTDEFVANADAQYGNLNFNQFSGYISGPIVDDTLMASVSGFYRHHDGYITNTFTHTDLNPDNAIGGRFRAIYNATSHLTFDFSADYLHEDDQEALLTTSLTPIPFPPYSTLPHPVPGQRVEGLDGPELGRREVHGFSARADYSFDDFRLTSISAFRAYQAAYIYDADGEPIPIGPNEFNTDNAHQFSQEFRATSTSSGPFQWIGGIYLYSETHSDTLNATFLQDFPSFALGLPPLPPGYMDGVLDTAHITQNSQAIFASGTYDITPDLIFTAGGRYTIENRHLNFSQVPTVVGTPSVIALLLADVPSHFETATDRVPTYDASLSYKFTQDQVGYLKFSRGYKAGGFNATLLTNPYVPGSSLGFKPEFLNNYEAGFKADWWDGHFSLNSDVFYDQYTDKQESVEQPTPPFPIVIQNAARATIYGAEFEATLIPVDGLTVTGTLGLLHGTYTSFPDANGTANFTGHELANAPRLTANFAIQYEHELPFASDLAGMARLEVTDTDSYFTDPNNSQTFQSRAVAFLNGRLGVERDNWGLYAWGKNLTNQYHLSNGVIFIIADGRSVNEPRTFGVELSWKY
jgi:iron complex outermembrane receptor protein